MVTGTDKIPVFAGPSLRGHRPSFSGIELDYRPPASQGDLIAAAVDLPRAIVLIDGYFENVPAVHHKEILWALDRGVQVYGAGSIGALRAAELRRFGMIGVGAIFEAFEAGELDGDDEVALVHGPAELGYEPLSEPLVNIRWTLALAQGQRVVERRFVSSLIDRAKATFYPNRSFNRLLDCHELPEDRASARRLQSWLPGGRVDQKHLDAMACLGRATSDLQRPLREPGRQSHEFVFTDAFSQLVQCMAAGLPLGDRTADRLLRLVSDRTSGFSESALGATALAMDRATKGPVPVESLAETVRSFLKNVPGGNIDSWMKSRSLDIDTLSRILEDVARIERSSEEARKSIYQLIHSRLKI